MCECVCVCESVMKNSDRCASCAVLPMFFSIFLFTHPSSQLCSSIISPTPFPTLPPKIYLLPSSIVHSPLSLFSLYYRIRRNRCRCNYHMLKIYSSSIHIESSISLPCEPIDKTDIISASGWRFRWKFRKMRIPPERPATERERARE